ncbi:MAG: hypothetical protein WCX97_04685 [Candidatus Magasanikbacteria bacterium]
MSDIDQQKQAAWEAGNLSMRDLNNQGAQIYFSKEFPDLKHAFSNHTTCVVCMDEGTAHKDMEEGDKLALAGSGMLFPASNEDERLDKVADLMIACGVKTITSHGGCGAAGIAYKRDFPTASPTADDIENYAINWAKNLTERINNKQQPAEHVHIAGSEMERPMEFHNARVVYFDAVGGFNPSKEKGLPMGFVIERKFIPVEYALAELKVAVNIAFGHHGLGELFDKDNPFIIIVLASNEENLENLRKEVKDALQNDENFKAGKVKIDGMVI